MKLRPILLAILAACSAARGDTFLVATTGVDDSLRDGRTPSAAWASLAFACEHLPPGPHTILLGPGEFRATRTTRPGSEIVVAGSGSEGPQATRLVAAGDWKLADTIQDMGPPEEYLIVLSKVSNVAVRDLVLCSTPERRITGAVRCQGSRSIVLERLVVRDFRWNGLALENSEKLVVRDCLVENASTEKLEHCGGLIRTRWIKDSEVGHNRIVSSVGPGYGYKGSGHVGLRLHHNHLEVAGSFAIESAHENEFGVQIDHNFLNGCVSVPKGGQGADPRQRDHEYSFWIHHNLMTDSYAVEGPRNHLRFDHNYVRCEKPGGRIYTQHGGVNHGPVWIHHNIIENADRGFIWMNQGLAENLEVFNNTVLFADAGPRAGSVLGAYSGERLSGWVVKNNVFIAPESQPRAFLPTERGVPQKITATDNVCLNITQVPAGNHTPADAGLNLRGEKPVPFFAPVGAASFVVGRGADVGLPFTGRAPDIGAVQLDDPAWRMPLVGEPE